MDLSLCNSRSKFCIIKCNLAAQHILRCAEVFYFFSTKGLFIYFYLESSCCVQLGTSFPAWPRKGQWWSPGCVQEPLWPLFAHCHHPHAESSHYHGAPGELHATRRCPGDESTLSGWSLRLRGCRKQLTSPEISAREKRRCVKLFKVFPITDICCYLQGKQEIKSWGQRMLYW